MPEMYRARTQVLFRYAPKSLFRFNDLNAWCEVTSIELQNVRPMTSALAEALWHVLDTWDSLGQSGFPDPRQFPHKYEVGDPYQVHYTLTPLVFSCRSCRRVQWYRDLYALMRNPLLQCRGCKSTGTLVQVPYVFVHECGAADSIYVPSHDPTHSIVMNNRGRFQESNWYCQTCHRALTKPGSQGLGFRRCDCAPGQFKRGTTLQDPGVHYVRTISLVDTDDQILERALENANLGESLLAGLGRTAHYDSTRFAEVLEPSPAADALEEKREAARQDLMAKGISDPKTLDTILGVMEGQFVSPRLDLQRQLRDDVHALVGSTSPLTVAAKESRQLREYLFVRDHQRMQAQSLSSLLVRARTQDDQMTRARYEADETVARKLGIANLQVLEAFPLLLAAVGYSRVTPEPKPNSTARLNPFITNRPKIPLYAIQSTTEALLFELDPWREVAWLLENGFVETPQKPFANEADARLFLLRARSTFLERRDAHLALTTWEKERGLAVDLSAGASFGLVHSLSHMLIVAASTHVGLDADSLGEYLFPVAGAGVVYASGHQEFTLGGIVSAFRLNLSLWLTGAYEAAQRCIYDPLCKAHGGACHACTYLRFSCPDFNRTVSRSFLLGGPVGGLTRPLVGFWSPTVVERANTMKHELSS